jgi:hypothetical protein
VGNEEDAIFPDAYITSVQQAKYDKEVHQYTHKKDGSKNFFTTSEPPKTLNRWNEKHGAAFYHHMVVHALGTILDDSQDNRICGTRDPLIKNAQRITVEGKPFYTGLIHRNLETQQLFENWMPQRVPIVTIAMTLEKFHHVHVGFQWGTPINLSKVRAISRQDNAGNKKQRVK